MVCTLLLYVYVCVKLTTQASAREKHSVAYVTDKGKDDDDDDKRRNSKTTTTTTTMYI